MNQLEKIDFNPTFLAFMDVLGFKNLAKKNEHAILVRIYQNLLETLLSYSTIIFPKKSEMKKIDNDKGRITLKIDQSLPKFNSMIISDSIIIWTNDANIAQLQRLIFTIKNLLNLGIEMGMPLRGAITKGSLTYLKLKDEILSYNSVHSIIGHCIIKAFEEEENQNWVGCILNEEVISSIPPEYIKVLENHNLITRYRIPFKKEPIKDNYAIIWGDEIIKNDVERVIRNAFSAHKKCIDNGDEIKIKNTISFLEYINALKISKNSPLENNNCQKTLF
ncbi:MAG: hypothetical protein HWN66_10150 [Candidatus Helarchaeota archaeon]|nr:hypothetical protein [Candidatus Helarchaeota archaeon]